MRLFSAPIVLILTAANARALSSASPADKALIQQHLNKATVSQAVVNREDRALQVMELALKSNPRDGALIALADQHRVTKYLAEMDRDLERNKAVPVALTAFLIL